MSVVIMVQGTTADAGKSVFATALCRLLADEGWQVAPFCAQSIGAETITLPEGRISWSQFLQAEAAGVTPRVEMNPLLLAPLTENTFQLTAQGMHKGELTRQEYLAADDTTLALVQDSLQYLRSRYEVVVIEGAATPVELHRPELELPNMGLAKALNAPVLLVSDIDRGGMFAYVAGTLALLPEEEQQLIEAVIINRFRGFRDKLQPGLEMLEEIIHKPVIGVIPHLNDLALQYQPTDAITATKEKREQTYRLLAQTLRENLDLAFMQTLLPPARNKQ